MTHLYPTIENTLFSSMIGKKTVVIDPLLSTYGKAMIWETRRKERSDTRVVAHKGTSMAIEPEEDGDRAELAIVRLRPDAMLSRGRSL